MTALIEDYALIGDGENSCSRVSERLNRRALPAPIRFGCLLSLFAGETRKPSGGSEWLIHGESDKNLNEVVFLTAFLSGR